MNNSSVICIDANVVIRLVVEPADRVVRRQWEDWERRRFEFVAPTLLYYEIANGLYQYERAAIFQPDTVRQGLESALALPVRLIGQAEFHRGALEFATRFALRASYDAHYLALADRLGIGFYTADERLYRRVREELKWVHLVGEKDEP